MSSSDGTAVRRISARMRARSSSYAYGLTDDVIGAALERTHALDGVRPCGEHDDRNVPIPRPPGLAAPKPQAEVELGEQDDVGTRGLRELERLAAPRGTEDVEAVVAKLPAEKLARLGLRLGDENGTRHAADASPARSSPPDVLCSGFADKRSSAVGSDHGR